MKIKAAYIAALMLGVYFMFNTVKPRGIRNNNPLNIRISSDNWNGSVGDDGSFIQFESPLFGIRAAARILKNYRDKYGLNTVAGIVNRWAPPSENNTQSYINSVSGKVGVDANQALNDSDYKKLIAAMIYHENGSQPYSIDEIKSGFDMGFYT
jgi:hypothetical protein